MTYSIFLTKIAKHEITEAFLWYEEKQDNLGFRFEEHITDLIENIQRNPRIYQVRYRDVRIAFMRKFPYGVHFKINGTQIIVIGVYHTSRDSAGWDR